MRLKHYKNVAYFAVKFYVLLSIWFLFNQSKIAANITLEQGKTLADAEGDVMRGLRKST